MMTKDELCEMTSFERLAAFRHGDISHDETFRHYSRRERRTAMHNRQRRESKELRQRNAEIKAIKDIESKCGKIMTLYVGGKQVEDYNNVLKEYYNDNKRIMHR